MSQRSLDAPRGTLGRAGRLAVSSVYSGFAPALLLLNPMGAVTPPLLSYIAVLLLLLTIWLWVRLPFTGVTVNGDVLMVNGWFTRKIFNRDDLVRFRVESYGGPFYYLAWAIDAGPFESGELRVELADGTQVALRGTVCGRRVANEIARSLNDWLGLNSDPRSTPRVRERRGRDSSPGSRHPRGAAG